MSNRPNIVIITTHDSGKHFGCYGVGGVRTPNIDTLAEDGVRFDRMFGSSSICTPSRGSLLTGQWPERNGLLGLSGAGYRYELVDKDRHLSSVLRKNGYRTALYGHEHEAIDSSDLGFDTVFPIQTDGRRRDCIEITDAAAEFIYEAGHAETPFYLQIGFHETHTPYLDDVRMPDDPENAWLPPYTLYDSMDDELREHIAGFQASVHSVDRAVGTVTAALEAAGIAEDTLLLFNTDHGAEMPRAKWTMYDAGINIAFIMRWPAAGLSGGKVVDTFLANADFVPTLAEMTDIEVPHDTDGKSFASLLRGDASYTRGEPALHSFAYGYNWAVRTDRYKLIRNFNGTMFNVDEFHRSAERPVLMLFDFESDPLEQHNLAESPEYREVRERLNDTLWRYLDETASPVLEGHIYHPPVQELYAEYEAGRGEWSAHDDPDFELTAELPSRFTGRSGRFVLSVNFNAGTRKMVSGLYAPSEDPELTRDLSQDPEYAETFKALKRKLWARLEKEERPILDGIEPSPTHAACLAEYERWKKART